MRITTSFFLHKSTLEIAQNLLGKVLVYHSPKGLLKGLINETEAYSQDEPSCHAFQGKRTRRNEVMFWSAGHLYVYFTYGMHYCINVVTAEAGCAEAVLIRSLIPLEGEDIMLHNRNGNKKHLADGPAKLAQAYGLNKSHNGLNLLAKDARIYLEDLGFLPEGIQQTARIGIRKAVELPWRFYSSSFKSM